MDMLSDCAKMLFLLFLNFLNMKRPHNLQDVTFNNIQRRKPILEIKLKGTWEGSVIINWCALRSKIFVKNG